MTDPTMSCPATTADAASVSSATVDPAPSERSGRRFSVADLSADYAVVGFFVLLIVLLTWTMPSKFVTSGNIESLLSSNGVSGILALAVVLPLAAGEFDLSIAANLGFTSVLAAKLASQGHPTITVLIACLLVGTGIGAINAFLVVNVGINAFIATLGVSTILAGGNLWLSGGTTIFQGISPSFGSMSTNKLWGVQYVFFYFVAAALILWYLLEHTPFGRYLRATGMGREAARLSGVRTNRYLSSAFLLAGLLAGLCGVLQTALTSSATPSIGPEFLLPAYAAAFLGAATIRRGKFNALGTVVAVFVLALGTNGLTLAGAKPWVPYVFNGAALVVAVSAGVLLARRPAAHSR